MIIIIILAMMIPAAWYLTINLISGAHLYDKDWKHALSLIGSLYMALLVSVAIVHVIELYEKKKVKEIKYEQVQEPLYRKL